MSGSKRRVVVVRLLGLVDGQTLNRAARCCGMTCWIVVDGQQKHRTKKLRSMRSMPSRSALLVDRFGTRCLPGVQG